MQRSPVGMAQLEVLTADLLQQRDHLLGAQQRAVIATGTDVAQPEVRVASGGLQTLGQGARGCTAQGMEPFAQIDFHLFARLGGLLY